MTSIDVNSIVTIADASVAMACTHCGLPVPAGRVPRDQHVQFCCAGCRAVHEMIASCGLDQFYRLREIADDTPHAATVTGRGFAEFDDETFLDLYARELPDGQRVIELYVDGVHCGACVWLIEKLPHLLPGLTETRLDLGRSIVRVTWHPETTPLSAIARRLDGFGYTPRPCRGRGARELRRAEDRKMLVRIAVAGAVAGNVMGVSFALYGGMLHGMDDLYLRFFRIMGLALTLLSLLWPGRVFLQGALAALRTRTMHMDLPIAIGLLAGTGWGAANCWRTTGEVYFDSVTALIFLLLIGRWLLQRSQRASYDALEMLSAMTPSVARVVGDDGPRDVPLEALTPGDRVEIRAGETVPADGEIIEGRSSVNASLLTGESMPAPVEVGDVLHAGIVNLGSRLLVLVTATGEQTRVGRLMRLVQQCAHGRAPVVRLADRVAGVFVGSVLALAGLTVVLWWRVDPALAIEHAMALLIVSCPCALGLATPMAMVASIGRAARRRIMIKGGEALQTLAQPGRLILDKTGTVTRGELSLVAWRGDESVKPLAAALERHSAHPVARALVEALGDDLELAVDGVMETTGSGIIGSIDGRRVAVGSAAYHERHGATVPDEAREWLEKLRRDHLSPVLIAIDDRIVAAAGLGDPILDDARAVLDELRAGGWRIGMLSGDDPAVVEHVANHLGIPAADARGGVTPEAKAIAIAEYAARGPVVMVGDGVNDAAALASATVGVAVRGGAEASLAAADVYLAGDGLSQLVALGDAARRTMAVVRRNIVMSLIYNAIGVSLAMGGMLNPLVAAVLMPLSSLMVIAHTVKSRTFEGADS